MKMLKRKQKSSTGNIMSDSVVTANEAGGWHGGRPVLFIASEDEDHIARNQKELKARTEKPRRLSPWRLQERQVKNILIEAPPRELATLVVVVVRGALYLSGFASGREARS